MTSNDSTFYLGYLNKIVEQHNNNYYCSIGLKPIDPDYSDLTKEIESSYKAPKFKVGDRAKIIKYKNIFVKVTLKIGQEKYLLLILC